MADRERYYLLLNKTPEAGLSVSPGVAGSIRSTRLHGHLYAYDKTSGDIEWFFDLTNQYLVLEQFEDLPVVICASYINKFNANGNERQLMKIAGIDKRSGKQITDDKWTLAPAQFYALATDAKAGIIELLRHDVKIRFAPEGQAIGSGIVPPAGDGAVVPSRPGLPAPVPLPAPPRPIGIDRKSVV